MTERKYMSIKEFIESGFLQEVNRRLLHPCGLALEAVKDGDEWRLGGVWDARDDPEGIMFDETGPPDWRKRNRVNETQNACLQPRVDVGLSDPFLGPGIQPCPEMGE